MREVRRLRDQLMAGHRFGTGLNSSTSASNCTKGRSCNAHATSLPSAHTCTSPLSGQSSSGVETLLNGHPSNAAMSAPRRSVMFHEAGGTWLIAAL